MNRIALYKMICRGCRRPAAAAVLLLSLSACGEKTGDVPQAMADLPRGTPLDVSENASVVLGVASGDAMQEFADIVSPFLLGDSLLVVPTRGHHEIRVFDRNGRYLRSLGGPGEGPGEFGRIGGVWFRGDTIEALDLAFQRVTRFPPGEVPDVTTLRGSFVMWGVGPVSNGWFLVNLAQPGTTNSNPRDQWAMYTFARSGERLASLGRVEGIRRFSMAGMPFATDPWTPSARFAVGAGEIHVGDTLVPEVRVMNEEGQLLRTVRLNLDPSNDFSQTLASVRARLETDSPVGDGLREQLDAAPQPEIMPYFTDILVDDKGFLWVRPYEPARDATVMGGRPDVHVNNPGGEWQVFSPTGIQVGSVRVPDDLAPYQITSTALVGISRSELGVESVRVHDLVRH